MATYRIENNEILIDFEGVIPSLDARNEMKADKRFRWDPDRAVWHGSFNPENEALAQTITGVIPSNISLEERLQMCIEAPGVAAKTQLTESLMGSVEERLDEYLEYIHRAKGEENAIQEIIANIESKIEDEKSAYELQKKAVASKRAIIEAVLVSYLNSVGEERLKGALYNVSIKESYSYKLDDAFEQKLRAKLSAILPEWIDVDFKIRKEAKEMDPKPEGIVIGKSKQYISVWSDDEMEPEKKKKDQDLLLFKQGKSIQEIADERKVEWKTVFNNIKKCMTEGSISIQECISQGDLDRISALYIQNNDMKPYDYVRALGNTVSYDIIILSLSYLGLSRW